MIKISLLTTLHLLISFSSFTQSSRIERAINWGRCPYQLNKKEISDSGFHSLLIHTLYSDHIGSENWRDTLYYASFNNKGQTIYEKRTDLLNGSLINEFEYNDQGQLLKTISNAKDNIGYKAPRRYTINNNYKSGLLVSSEYTEQVLGKNKETILKQYKYDSNERVIQVTDGPDITNLIYNHKGELIKTEYKWNDSSSSVTIYSRKVMDGDSVVNYTAIEKITNKVDSSFGTLIYNSNGQLISQSRRISPTYYKNFPTSCSTGDTYTYKYEYDEMGQEIIKENYISRYYNNGYVKESEKDRSDIVGLILEGTDWNNRWILSVQGNTTILKTFISKKSNLLLSIDKMDGRNGNEKTFFEFSKH